MATAAKDQQVESRSTQVPWYTADLETISEPARQLLETYSKIPPDQVIPHIIRIVRPSPSFTPRLPQEMPFF